MPQFCKNTSILIVVIAAVLISLIITLMQGENANITYFNLTSLYMVWLFILWAACICLIGKLKLQELPRFIACVIGCLTTFIIYEISVQLLYANFIDLWRMLRLTAVALIFLLITLRAIQLSTIYSERSRADLKTRLSALQSKIEPHFLFNSLNTIAELTHISPEQAESAIHSLSTILRSNLKDDDAFHSAEEEVMLCEKYIELEKWRLGDRLDVLIKVSPSAKNAIIPKLIFQPVIENAIRHGIAPFKDGGTIEVAIRMSKKQLTASIINIVKTRDPIPEKHDKQLQGHGIAINNVRERLFVIYDDRYQIKARQSDHRYYVELSLPTTPPKEIALKMQ
ncbi:MAG: sensor histidine kinase [Arenicella sp.]